MRLCLPCPLALHVRITCHLSSRFLFSVEAMHTDGERVRLISGPLLLAKILEKRRIAAPGLIAAYLPIVAAQ